MKNEKTVNYYSFNEDIVKMISDNRNNLKATYDCILYPEVTNQKSFYGKALIQRDVFYYNGVRYTRELLFSYEYPVLSILKCDDNGYGSSVLKYAINTDVKDWDSHTTLKHIKEALYQATNKCHHIATKKELIQLEGEVLYI